MLWQFDGIRDRQGDFLCWARNLADAAGTSSEGLVLRIAADLDDWGCVERDDEVDWCCEDVGRAVLRIVTMVNGGGQKLGCSRVPESCSGRESTVCSSCRQMRTGFTAASRFT